MYVVERDGESATVQRRTVKTGQVRGERVEVATPDAVQGIIVGVETQGVRECKAGGCQSREIKKLNLLTSDGLRSLALSQIGRIRFLRKELEQEFTRLKEYV